MAGDDGRLGFSISLDTRGLEQGASEARRMLASIGESAEQESKRTDGAFAKLRDRVAGAFTLQNALGFAREVVNVRKEIVSLETSLRQLAGSQGAADALLGELRSFYNSQASLEFKDLAAGAQTMMGFGIAAQETVPILKAIGDISMGDSERFKSLSLAFSQASSTGKLMGQDLMQMINAGFNPLAQISEATGKSIGELKEQMAAGGISAAMLKDAFLGASAAGGRFHGMLAAQSQGLAGATSNLKAAYTDMLNDIGSASEGAIGGLARGGAALLKNYREVGAVLATLIGTYGTARAAATAWDAAKKAGAEARVQEEARLLEAKLGAASKARLAQAGLQQGTEAYALEVKRLAAEEARLAQVELARARAAVKGAAEAAAAKRTEYLAAKQRAVTAKAELAEAQRAGNARALEAAQRRVATAETARQAAGQRLLAASRARNTAQTVAQTAAGRAAAASQAIETAATEASAVAQGKLAKMKMLAVNAANKLKAALLANPYMLIAAAVTAVGYAIYKLATYQTEAQKAQARLNKAFQDGEAAAAGEMAKVDALFGTLEGATKGTREYEDAKAAIISQYGKYLKGLGDEESALQDVAAAYEAVAAGVLKAARTKAKEAYVAKEQEEFQKKYSEEILELREKLVDKFGERKGAEVFVKLKPVFDGKRALEELDVETQRAVARFTKYYQAPGTQEGMQGKNTQMRSNVIEEYVKSIRASKEVFENSLREAEEIFGESALARPTDLAGWQAYLKQLQEEEKTLTDIEKAGKRGEAIRRDIAEAQLAIEKLSAPPKENKAYWEEKKKALDAELAALVAEEAAGAKGLALKAKIAVVNEKLEAYNTNGKKGGGRAGGRGVGDPTRRLAELAAKEAAAAREAALAVRRAEIDGMEEGFAKEMAVAQLRYEQMRAENAKRRDEMVADARERFLLQGKTKEAAGVTADTLPEAQLSQLAAYDRINEEELARAQREALAKVMEEVMTYQQKRLEVETDFAARRKALYEKDGETLRAGVTEGNLDELTRKQEEALSAVDAQFAEREATYQTWLATLSQYTLDELKRALTEAETALATLEKKGDTSNQMAEARARVAQLKKEIAQAERAAASKANPQEQVSAWSQLARTVGEAQRGFKALGDAVGGSAGKMLNGISEIMGGTGRAIAGIQQLVEASSASMAASAAAGSRAMSMVEKGSMILTILATVVQVGMVIASMFDRTEEIDAEIKARQAEIDALQWELDHREAVELWEQHGEEIKNIFAEVAAASAAYMEAAFYDSMVAGDKISRQAAEAYRQAYAQAVGKLAKKFKTMDYLPKDPLGLDRYKNAGPEIENIAQQIIALQRQIAAEKSKKEKDIDYNQIAQWEQQQRELMARAARVTSEAVEDIIGYTAQGLAEELGGAMVDAFMAGEDAAEAWGKKVDEVVSNMAKKMLIKQMLEKPMAEIMNKFKNTVFDEKGNFKAGVLNSAIRDMQESLKSTRSNYQMLQRAIQENSDFFNNGGLKDAAEEEMRGAAAKGIATASQETVDELNGRMTAVQGHTYALMEGSKILQSTTAGILASVRGIEETTARMDGRLAVIEIDAARTRKALEEVRSNGTYMLG